MLIVFLFSYLKGEPSGIPLKRIFVIWAKRTREKSKFECFKCPFCLPQVTLLAPAWESRSGEGQCWRPHFSVLSGNLSLLKIFPFPSAHLCSTSIDLAKPDTLPATVVTNEKKKRRRSNNMDRKMQKAGLYCSRLCSLEGSN